MKLYSITGYHSSGIGLWTKVFEQGAQCQPGMKRLYVMEPGKPDYWLDEHGNMELHQPVMRVVSQDDGA